MNASNYDIALQDIMDLFCGEKIGGGAERDVYKGTDFLTSKHVVIKIATGNYSYQNALEWSAWEAVRDTPHKKWFAPCVTIGNNGRVLIMERTTPIPENRLPKKMPIYLTDTKRANYGLYKGRVVCHDYGLTMLMEHGLSNKMKTVDWWGDAS